MSYITAIGFQIVTRDWEGAGTDSRVEVTVRRDGQDIETHWIERGNTPRLDRGDNNFYWFRFGRVYFDPPGLGTSTGGEGPRPGGVEFRHGVYGHLICKFRIFGDDAWIADRITVKVKYARREHVPNTIDTFKWVEDRHWTSLGTVENDIKMSTDAGDGGAMPAHNPVYVTI
jgi:hypothetical protein